MDPLPGCTTVASPTSLGSSMQPSPPPMSYPRPQPDSAVLPHTHSATESHGLWAWSPPASPIVENKPGSLLRRGPPAPPAGGAYLHRQKACPVDGRDTR